MFPILAGYRGREYADVEAAADCISRFSQFAERAKRWVSEMEINPLLVLSQGKGVRALDALIVKRKPLQ